MQPVLHLHVGGAGLRSGQVYWEQAAREAGLSASGTGTGEGCAGAGEGAGAGADKASDEAKEGISSDSLGVLFEESKEGSWRPRSILIDSTPEDIDELVKGPYRWLVADTVTGDAGSGGGVSNFATRSAHAGGQVVRDSLGIVRDVLERTDTLQGFMITHSLGGGTGSGTTSTLVYQLKELYPDKMILSFPILSAPALSTSVVEPYNAAFATQHMVEDVDMCVMLDNVAMLRAALRSTGQATAVVSDLNGYLRSILSNATCSLRQPLGVNGNLASLGVNLVPYPRSHFLAAASAPLACSAGDVGSGGSLNRSARASLYRSQLKQVFSADHFLLGDKIEFSSGEPAEEGGGVLREMPKLLTSWVLVRGPGSSSADGLRALKEIESFSELADGQRVKIGDDTHICPPVFHGDFQPEGVACSATSTAMPGVEHGMSTSMLCNSLMMAKVFERMGGEFTEMFGANSHVASFTSVEGCDIDDMAFTEADSALNDITWEYVPTGAAADDTDSDFYDDESDV